MTGREARLAGNGQERYTGVAIALHWVIAVLILYNLASGLLRSSLPRAFFGLHETTGISILALSAARIAWRLTHRPPPRAFTAPWQAALSHTVHFCFYTAMVVLPLTGWALVSATPPLGSPGAAWYMAHLPPAPPGGGVVPQPHVIIVFGSLHLPAMEPVHELGRLPAGVPGQRALHETIKHTHLLGGYVMLLLLVLHLAGVLKHIAFNRERPLGRMGIGRG